MPETYRQKSYLIFHRQQQEDGQPSCACMEDVNPVVRHDLEEEINNKMDEVDPQEVVMVPSTSQYSTALYAEERKAQSIPSFKAAAADAWRIAKAVDHKNLYKKYTGRKEHILEFNTTAQDDDVEVKSLSDVERPTPVKKYKERKEHMLKVNTTAQDEEVQILDDVDDDCQILEVVESTTPNKKRKFTMTTMASDQPIAIQFDLKKYDNLVLSQNLPNFSPCACAVSPEVKYPSTDHNCQRYRELMNEGVDLCIKALGKSAEKGDTCIKTLPQNVKKKDDIEWMDRWDELIVAKDLFSIAKDWLTRGGFELLIDAALDKFEERNLLKYSRDKYHYCKGLANKLGTSIDSLTPDSLSYNRDTFISYASHLKHWHSVKNGIIIMPINIDFKHWIIIIRDENGSYKCFDHFGVEDSQHDKHMKRLKTIHTVLEQSRDGPVPPNSLYLGTGAQYPDMKLCGPWAFNAIEQVLLTGEVDVSNQSRHSMEEYRANLIRRFLPWMKLQGSFLQCISPLLSKWDERAQ